MTPFTREQLQQIADHTDQSLDDIKLLDRHIRHQAFEFERRGLVGSHKAIDVEDLISVGYEALIVSAEKYSEDKTARFPTFAFPQIWRRMLSEIHNMGDAVPVPEYLHWYVIRHVADAIQELTQKYKRTPTLEELQTDELLVDQITGYRDTKGADPNELIKDAMMYLSDLREISMDSREGEEVLLMMDDFDVEEETDTELLGETIAEALKILPTKQRQVLMMRFGFDGEPKSLREIAFELGLSVEGVRKREKAGLDRLRQDPRTRVKLRNWS